MNQKEAVQTILEKIDSEEARVKFITEWLTDINWHPESALISETYPDTNYEANRKVVKANRQENHYEWELKNAVSLVRGFNYIFGWGLDNSWSSTGQGQAFVKELIDMITPPKAKPRDCVECKKNFQPWRVEGIRISPEKENAQVHCSAICRTNSEATAPKELIKITQ